MSTEGGKGKTPRLRAYLKEGRQIGYDLAPSTCFFLEDSGPFSGVDCMFSSRKTLVAGMKCLFKLISPHCQSNPLTAITELDEREIVSPLWINRLCYPILGKHILVVFDSLEPTDCIRANANGHEKPHRPSTGVSIR